MIKVQRDNVVLSIDESILGQYEARGYNRIGATKKVAPEKLQKEIDTLTKANEELTKANKKLTKKIENLDKKVK